MHNVEEVQETENINKFLIGNQLNHKITNQINTNKDVLNC